MLRLVAHTERGLRVMAASLLDLAGWPFRWLILRSPVSRWLQRTDPNSWSLLRLPLSFVIALLLQAHADDWAMVVLAIALLTDRLDGELARLTNRCSLLGEKIDTFVDAALMGSVFIGLAVRLPMLHVGPLVMPLVTVIVSVEAARLFGGFLLSSWSQTPDERAALLPNHSGKYKMALLGLGAFLSLLGYITPAKTILIAAIGLGLYSLTRHVVDWIMARRTRPPTIS